jgi:hypothetical protein
MFRRAIILSLAGNSTVRISAPFLHHFCTMKSNSKLYRGRLGKVLAKPQAIVNERHALEADSWKTFLGEEKVKFW